MKFRKKPIVIDATQFDGTRDGALKLGLHYSGATDAGEEHYFVRTLEGLMRAMPGDWIITGVKGELYPCKPDIFAATYEAVE